MSWDSRKSGGKLLGSSTPNETFQVLHPGGRTDGYLIESRTLPFAGTDTELIERGQALGRCLGSTRSCTAIPSCEGRVDWAGCTDVVVGWVGLAVRMVVLGDDCPPICCMVAVT